MTRNVFVAAACAACLLVAHGAEKAAPFGVRLGERIGDPVPVPTAEDLEAFILTNGIPTSRIWPSSVTVDLSHQLLGITRAAVQVDQDGVGYEFTIHEKFRRGLAREESLRKIEALRKDVERECGFKLNDYSFSNPRGEVVIGRGLLGRRGLGESPLRLHDALEEVKPRTLSPDTVGGEGSGPELWLDIDSVVADSVTTYDGMRVSIHCGVNVSYEKNAGGLDSPIDVTVSVLLVDVLRKAEVGESAKRRLLSDRQKVAKSARINEFYGVEFGKPTQTPTNELTKGYYETWYQGDKGEKKGHAKIHHWTKELKGVAVPFVDKVFVEYSLDTKIPGRVTGFGRIPKDVDAQEAMRRLDEFALGMNKKYGMTIHRSSEAEDATKDGHVQYTFNNNNVSLVMYIRTYKGEGAVDFRLENEAGEKAVRDEGWEAISEKDKDAEGE